MSNKKSIKLNIEGMSCGHCIAAVEKALKDTAGIDVEQVEIGAAVISYDGKREHRDAAVNAVSHAGYPVMSVEEVT